MSVRGRHCDYSAQAPKNLAMPLHTQISKRVSIHAYIPLRNLLNKLVASKKVHMYIMLVWGTQTYILISFN